MPLPLDKYVLIFCSAEHMYFLSTSPGELWALNTLFTIFLLGNFSLYKAVNIDFVRITKAFTF